MTCLSAAARAVAESFFLQAFPLEKAALAGRPDKVSCPGFREASASSQKQRNIFAKLLTFILRNRIMKAVYPYLL